MRRKVRWGAAGHLPTHIDLVHYVGLRWTVGTGHAKGVPWSVTEAAVALFTKQETCCLVDVTVVIPIISYSRHLHT